MKFSVFLLHLIVAVSGLLSANAQALAGCPETCGDLTIPYPFGTVDGCYLDKSFMVTCNSSGTFLDSRKVLDISLGGDLKMYVQISRDCYDQFGNRTLKVTESLRLSNFTVSSSRNKFTAVGCDAAALIEGPGYLTGCMSLCESLGDVVNGSCSGVGCCQTSIPRDVKDITIDVQSFYGHLGVWNFSKCSYAFLVDEHLYSFSSFDLDAMRNIDEFPLVIDWAVGTSTCEEAERDEVSPYACKEHSVCRDNDNGPGYRCFCSEGYHGNPYLANGCQDINECHNSTLNDCTHICKNTAGNFMCHCPKGYYGSGRKGEGCVARQQQVWKDRLTMGTIMSFLVIFIICPFLYCGVRKRKKVVQKQQFFKQNGGIMLQQLLSHSKSQESSQKAIIFSEEQLNKATNNFSDNNVVGQGGYGTVYKGTLPNTSVLAIKKSKLIDRTQIEQFVNEVIILSQIKHPNVVKLLGCCLETPVPLLVYEFITNNTLSHHIHSENSVNSMPWEVRLRIAIETASALAHMHSAPMHVIHRDVKSTNILLESDYTAKVSDFGVSRLVPFDQTHLPTIVQGTFGYIDPEYFHSGMLTKKSDVYSFGVVLVELLTSQKVISMDRAEEDRSLATYFISSLENGRLEQVLDKRVRKEGDAEQLRRISGLAKKCLKLRGDKRPSMKEVKEELEALSNWDKSSWPKTQPDIEERGPLLIEPFGLYASGDTLIGFDSLNSKVRLKIGGGR